MSELENAIEFGLRKMYDLSCQEVLLEGKRPHLEALAKCIKDEKKYLDLLIEHGEGSPKLLSFKQERLDKSIHQFVMVTGLKYPIED